MNIKLKLLEFYVPFIIRYKILSEIYKITGEAFKDKLIISNSINHRKGLKRYAIYSNELTLGAIYSRKDLEEIKYRLYRNSYIVGHKLRKFFSITNIEEAMQTAEIFYDIIGIEFSANDKNEITINKCYFSDYYDCRVCNIISAIDEGIIAGLTNGAKINFINRITDGNKCCYAKLDIKDVQG